MPAVSSSLEKIPQNPPISPALRPETIRHPDKRSNLENDATCGLGAAKEEITRSQYVEELVEAAFRLRKHL